MATVRKAHVKRIYGKTAGIKDTGIWADVYRIDEYNDYSNPEAEGEVRHLRWVDKDVDDSNNMARETVKKKIVNPLDDRQVIEIKCVETFHMVRSSETEVPGSISIQGQGTQHHYLNDPMDNGQKTSRVFTKKKVFYTGTQLSNHNLWMSWDDYRQVYGDDVNFESGEFSFFTEFDPDSFIIMEFPELFYTSAMQGLDFQGRASKLQNKNKDPEAGFGTPTQQEMNTHPPVRLDPFQYIVNIRWRVPIFLGVGSAVSIAYQRFFDPTLSGEAALEAVPGWPDAVPHEGDPAAGYGTWHTEFPGPNIPTPPWVDHSLYSYGIGIFNGGSFTYTRNRHNFQILFPSPYYTAVNFIPNHTYGPGTEIETLLVGGVYSVPGGSGEGPGPNWLFGSSSITNMNVDVKFFPYECSGGYAYFTEGGPFVTTDFYRQCGGPVTLNTVTHDFSTITVTRTSTGEKWKAESGKQVQPWQQGGGDEFAGGSAAFQIKLIPVGSE